eukprot:8267413-Pyramimonas_sp.AAC.1
MSAWPSAMKHSEIDWALRRRGLRPQLSAALPNELVGPRAAVKMADANSSSYFPYERGGRRGGVETPDLFNALMEAALEDL